MEQNNSRNNRVSVGDVGSGNTVNITQHQAADPSPHIEYEVAQDTVEHLSQAEINKGALAFYGAISLPILAIVADSVGVLSFLGIQTKWALAVVLPIAAVGAILTNTKRKIATSTLPPNTAKFIDGQWVERGSNGDYVRYRKTAPCIYPKCSGSVFIQSAPPRAQPNHTLVGVCDVGGRRHTYTVDFNGIGYPEQFDWSEVDKP